MNDGPSKITHDGTWNFTRNPDPGSGPRCPAKLAGVQCLFPPGHAGNHMAPVNLAVPVTDEVESGQPSRAAKAQTSSGDVKS